MAFRFYSFSLLIFLFSLSFIKWKNSKGDLHQGINKPVTVIPKCQAYQKDPAGTTYKTIELNGKTWLAENLAYDIGKGSWCYEGKAANCSTHGRLYNWEAAQQACKALGNGWRLPTADEWKALAEDFGGYYDWNIYQEIGDLEKGYFVLLRGGDSGFSAILGGFRSPHGNYLRFDQHGFYWLATEKSVDDAWSYWFDGVDKRLNCPIVAKSHGLSCRCIQDD